MGRKEATHERIVEVAARVIRRSGYDGTGVADIMKEAGLTHVRARNRWRWPHGWRLPRQGDKHCRR